VRRALTRVLDTLAPPRLGRAFRWLFAAQLINSAGDGVAVAAGPLLVASQTRDPFLVSLALLSEYAPVLVFGVVSGTVADRVDRKTMVVLVNLGRAVVLSVLIATIVTGTVSIAIVLAALFILGTAENFADAASSTLIPTFVPKPDLGIANARMQGAFLLIGQLLLPPVGAFLFIVGPSIPFLANAAGFVLGAVLISRIAQSTRPERRVDAEATEETGYIADTLEGVRWLVRHPAMRTLALTIFTFNVTYGAAWGVLVLYARDRLGMNAVGFGLVTTAIAIGGVIGIVSYGWLERHFALGDIMRVGLCIETVTHLVLAVTTLPIVALGMLVIFGAHAFVWGTTATVVRQRAVPNELLGRVGGVYRVAIFGGIVIGTPIGGALASAFGITAPYWFAFAGSAALVAVLWRQFSYITHSGDEAGTPPAPGPIATG
jgi:MFS family permease